MTRVLRAVAGAAALAVATVVTWWAWLGRDTTYQIDSSGHESGPYTTGQVAGCVLTLAALLVIAVVLAVPALLAAAAMTVAFTAAWTVQAAASDETGLFAVGAILVLGGMAAGTAVVASCTALLRRRFRPA
jgi:hypothetical protein